MIKDIVVPVLLFFLMLVLHILRRQEVINKRVPLINLNYELGAAATFGTRVIQQDYFGVKELNGSVLILLADGVGQHGEFAAKLTVDTFRELFNNRAVINKPQYFFKRAANAANKKIINLLDERQGATAVAAAIINNLQLFYSVVGNSRIAVFRNGDLIPVSEGQTIDVLARHRYEEGHISKQETLALLNKHRQYNFLGQDSFEEIEFFSKPIPLRKNDLLVVMSEGVFNTVSWKELEEIFDGKQSPQILADTVIDRVDKSTIVDKPNATILICRCS